ncbi:concanavalin A-like lectin/glucanases family protein [Bacteriovorax sp. Seq25_V]|nr:concanavalin A-like lectin/glucanases family protein [Bacteriovorax sp. Seq25_V]
MLKNVLVYILIVLFISSCSDTSSLTGKIEISNIVNPDSTAPSISFISTPTSITGNNDYNLTYSITDNTGGSGVKTSTLSYSPDGISFKTLRNIGSGTQTIKFCVPNKNHPLPTFKIDAVDGNNNTASATLGDTGANFNITIDPEPILPNISSSNGTLTNSNSTKIFVDACLQSKCSADAIYYEPPSNNLSISLGSTQPAAGDSSWVTCQDVIDNGIDSPTFLTDNDYELKVWVKSEDTDYDSTPITHISSSSEDITVTYDTSAPDESSIVIEGTTLTGKSQGTYRFTDCTDIASVMINKAGAPPLATDSGWQACSSSAFSLKYTDFIEGSNSLKFWIKDSAENVNSAFVPFTTTYDPPNITVVGGPTISTSTANMTIEFCDEASITQVFFNETGTLPSASASGWQTCNTASGHFNYGPLSPGSTTLKAYFKYADGLISPNPKDVPVYFSPTVSWVETPVTRRPQASFKLASCEGVTSVFVKTPGPAPLATDSGWQTCSTVSGAITYDGLSTGTQTLNFWFKDALDNVYGEYATSSVTFTPPQTSVKDAPSISTPKAYLTVNTCTDIQQVLITMDDATTPTGAEGGWVSCNTASNALQSPNFGTDGSHTLRVWYKFTDNYVMPINNQHIVNYTTPDTTPPPLTTGDGATSDILATLDNGDGGSPPTLLANDSRADFTINSCSPTGSSEDDITGVYVGTSATPPANGDSGWQTCTTSASAIQSGTLPDGTNTLYVWFKDDAGNVNSSPITQTVIVDTSGDAAPPPRPLVTVENAPTLTTAPAQMTVSTCTDIDQVFVNNNADPQPSSGDTAWQNCDTATGAITYPIDIAGDYTLQVWFKDTAGNINPIPRNVSFIFDPVPSTLPEPIAYWSFDNNHYFHNKLIDIKGTSDLKIASSTTLSKITGKIKEAVDLDGANYFVTENSVAIKPTVAVTLSMWAYLTSGDGSTQHIAGNISSGGGYGFRQESNELRFYTNSTFAKISTADYTTGWHYITGTSDGQLVKIFIDGVLKDTVDLGSPQNITYGCAKIFAIGASVATCTDNVDVSNKFSGSLDELVLWDKSLTDTEAYNLFVDSQNKFKVNYSSTVPADITSATFFGAFEQNALLSISNCVDGKFIYLNETTHPPTANDANWTPCTSILGAFSETSLPQGAHELKVWTKDEYDNISAGYQKIDTTIISVIDVPKPLIHFNFDNTHSSTSQTSDMYSQLIGINNGATYNTPAIQNEGYKFTKSEGDYIETKYASTSMIETNLTFSVWAKLTNNDNRNQVIAGNRVTNSGYSIEIDGPNAELKFIVESIAGKRELAVTTTSFNTDFHNLVGTYDGQVAKFFIDGKLVASNDFGSSSNINYSCLPSFVIGAGATCNEGAAAGSHFDNIVDEVILWNSVISEADVKNIFNGQDTVPPDPVDVTPRNNEYTVGIPLVRVNIENCDDIASVYVTTDISTPTSDAANWQACSTTGDKIYSNLLANGVNTVKTWFKDAAGNVSLTSTDMSITFNYDFTIPEPSSYWTLDNVNVLGATAIDVTAGKDGIISNANSTSGASFEALSFNGTDSNILVNYDASHQPTSKVSLSAWINVASWPTADQYIAGNLNDGGYALVLGNGTVEFRVKANGSIQTVSTPSGTLSTATNYMITGVFNEGYLRLFINDVEIANNDMGATYNIDYTYANAFVIGASAGTANDINANYFSGTIDEVSFFSDAITDTVVTEMYARGSVADKIFYDVTPPAIPTTLNLIYYNALVSRANLTSTDCTGIDYLIVTASKFPPDKNDEDWQTCNTLTGGILSKELNSSDSYGKVWTKDKFGNISTTFQYTPITTNYDLPIARPIVHWTFDSAHNNSTTRRLTDRISGAILSSEKGIWEDVDPDPGNTVYNFVHYANSDDMLYNQAGVLNEAIKQPSTNFTRCDNCEHLRIKDKVSVSAWVYIPANHSSSEDVILGNYNGSSGYGIRFQNDAPIGPRVEFVLRLDNGQTLKPYLETSSLSSAWHLLTGVYDGQTASLYVDGIFIKSFSAATASAITHNTNIKFAVGNGPTGATLPLDWNASSYPIVRSTYSSGEIDEVLVWDKPLTGLMVSSLYHNGADIIYSADTTPPANPTLRRENQRETIYDNKLYLTVNSCTDISGVLVNEGTQPDKQDDRWQICRTRPGSFNRSLTEGGHTVTLWFKDLAGNVTPISSDSVAYYNNLTLPQANAYWPMDQVTYVGREFRDVISENFEHDMFAYNFESSLNTVSGFEAGKKNESANIGGRSYLTGDTSILTRPVNELSLSGWFYTTNGDNAERTLIESAYYDRDTSNPTDGYRLYLNAGNIYFKLGLTIAGERTISAPMALVPTGWNHFTAVFNNNQMFLYVNSSQVATTTLAENDFIKWTYTPRLNIGSNVETSTTRPGTFFSEKIDEIALWGQALTQSEINDIYNRGNTGQYLFDVRKTATNVNNAYVYHYDNFESRTKVTILNCTSTPFIYIGDPSVTSPDPKSNDWRECNTTPGAIISAKLPMGTQYVRIWSKNHYGDVSSGFAILEIPAIDDDDDLTIPLTYWSLDQDQRLTDRYYDSIVHNNAILSNTTNYSVIKDAINNGISTTTSNHLTSSKYHVNDEALGITVMFNATLTNGDTSSRGFYQHGSTRIYQYDGTLRFSVQRTYDTNYTGYVNSNPTIYLPTSEITSGLHHITAQYDGKNLSLWIDGIKRRAINAAEDNFSTDIFKTLESGTGPTYINRDTLGPFYSNGLVDEVMIFDENLTETEIVSYYDRLKSKLYAGDTTPPATVPTISLDLKNWTGTKWETGTSSENYLTLNDCTDIAAVYITVNDITVPLEDSNGWQFCSTADGSIEIPALANGDNTVRLWFKDSAGNVTSTSQDVIVNFTAQPTPTPTAYWSFDANTIYSQKAYESANRVDAELHYYSAIAGQVNEGLDFNNARTHVKIPSNTAFKPTDELSISFWADINDDAGDYSSADTTGTILSTMNNDGDGYYLWSLNQSRWPGAGINSLKTIHFYISLNGVKYRSVIPKDYIGYNRAHIVLTFDGRRVKWYVNGMLKHVDDFLTRRTISYDGGSNTPLYLGTGVNPATNGPNSDLYEGTLDELAIFNKSLTSTQIMELYTKGNTAQRIYDPARTITTPLNTKASIYDSSSNFFYGDRIRVTMNDCTDADLVLVNDSTTAPSATDENWQPCTTATGAILSSPLTTGTPITPRLWLKSFNGIVHNTSATLNGEVVNLNATVTIPRPTTILSLDSVASGHTSATEFYDSTNKTSVSVNGVIPSGNEPTATTDTAAVVAAGRDFNGVNQYMTFAPTGANTYETDLTISTWAYLVKGDTRNMTIISNKQNGATNAGGTAIRIKNNKLQFVMSVNTSSAIGLSAAEYSVSIDNYSYTTGFHHITGTFDGKILKIYLDGVYINKYNIPFYQASRYYSYSNYVTPWYIGAEADDNAPEAGSFFSGIIDEVTMWPTVLTEPQIVALYNYGAQYDIANTADGYAPNDPGIKIKDNKTIISSPFATFTMPSCTYNQTSPVVKDIPINSIYIKVDDATPPDNFTTGWQYCTKEADAIISSLISEGNSTIYIYFRDEEGDISSVPITFDVTYLPPEMENPRAYYAFEGNLNDSANNLHIRAATFSNPGGKVGNAYNLYGISGGTTDRTYLDDLNLDKNFAISVWYYPYDNDTKIFEIPNQITIAKTASETISATVKGSWWSTVTVETTEIVTPTAWNHIGVIREDGSIKVLLNGKIVASSSINDQSLQKPIGNFKLLESSSKYLIIDELAIYNKDVTIEQMQYLYYRGMKGQPVPTKAENYLAATKPNHYYNFDDANIVTTTLADLGKDATAPLTINNAVITGSVDAKVNQSFFIKRYEDTLEGSDGGGSINSVGAAQYLESSATIDIPNDFTISTWVKLTKTTYPLSDPKQETYTILSQWGDDPTEQSYRLYVDRTNNAGTVVFQYRLANNNLFQVTSALDKIFATDSNWYHITVRRLGNHMAMFINGKQSGFVWNMANSPLRTVTTKFRIGDITSATIDENRFEGFIDETAIWTSKALDHDQIYDVYQRGLNSNAISTMPFLAVSEPGSTIDLTIVNMKINECDGYESVWIAKSTDATPGASDTGSGSQLGWQTCSTAVDAFKTPLLVDGNNDFIIYFKKAGVVSTYTQSVTIIKNVSDTTPPALPTATLASSTPTDSAIAKFTIGSCADIAGVYVGTTGASEPVSGLSGWQGCSTIAGAITYPKLVYGVNNISLWFKDAAGNVQPLTRDFSITYNTQTIPVASLYLPFDKELSGAAGSFDLINSDFFAGKNNASLSANTDGIIKGSLANIGTGYLERSSGAISLSNELSFSSWVKIAKPSTRSVIYSRWDENTANNQFSIEVDSEGRLCLAFQTVNSAGGSSWNTSSYARKCSYNKVNFSQWSHIALTRKNANLYFYIDGIQEQSDAIDTGNFLSVSPPVARVGAQERNGAYYTVGSLDEMAIWTTELTQFQIEAIYSKGKNATPLNQYIQPQVPAVPSYYWTFDDADYTGGTYVLADRMGAMNLTNIQSASLTYAQDGINGVLNESFSFLNEEHLLGGPTVSLGTEFAISTWVYLEDDSDDDGYIISKWSTGQEEFRLYTSAGIVKFDFQTAGLTNSIEAPKALNYDAWNNIIVARKDGVIKLYINGAYEAVNSTVSVNPVLDTPNNLYIGWDGSGTDNYFTGLIDETVIYHQSLDMRQVDYVYKEGKAARSLPTTIKVSAAHASNTVSGTDVDLTIGDCLSFTDVKIQLSGTPAPGSGDAGWLACSEVVGAINFTGLPASSTTTLDIWFKNGTTVEGAATTTIDITTP